MSAPAPWKSAGGDALEGVFNPHPSSLRPAGAIPPTTTSIGAARLTVEKIRHELWGCGRKMSKAPQVGAGLEVRSGGSRMSAPAPWKSAGGDALEGVSDSRPISWLRGANPSAAMTIGLQGLPLRAESDNSPFGPDVSCRW